MDALVKFMVVVIQTRLTQVIWVIKQLFNKRMIFCHSQRLDTSIIGTAKELDHKLENWCNKFTHNLSLMNCNRIRSHLKL
jgi:hypothetical protein